MNSHAKMNNSARAMDANIEQHSTAKSIVLHLAPGAMATLAYVLILPLVMAIGYPSITALYLPMILTVIIVEMGYLLYQGRKRNGTVSLKGVVNYREPVAWWM